MEKKILLKNALDIECKSLIQKEGAIYAAIFGGVTALIIELIRQSFPSYTQIAVLGFLTILLDQHYRTKKKLQEKIESIKELI